MASQRPILIHAPKDSSVVRYAEKHSFAFTVTTPTAGALSKTLHFLRENQETLQKNVANAWRQVCLAHDVNRNALILENYLWPTRPVEGNEPR